MDKSKQKTEIVWNTEVINALAKNYNFSKRYIKQIISGDRTPIFQDRIIVEYRSMCKEVDTILNQTKL
jgi:hypothetical protein